MNGVHVSTSDAKLAVEAMSYMGTWLDMRAEKARDEVERAHWKAESLKVNEARDRIRHGANDADDNDRLHA